MVTLKGLCLCFRCLKFALHLDPVHCSTKLSIWAGAALYFSKLRLRWSTIDMYFTWPHFKKHELSLWSNHEIKCSQKQKSILLFSVRVEKNSDSSTSQYLVTVEWKFFGYSCFYVITMIIVIYISCNRRLEAPHKYICWTGKGEGFVLPAGVDWREADLSR